MKTLNKKKCPHCNHEIVNGSTSFEGITFEDIIFQNPNFSDLKHAVDNNECPSCKKPIITSYRYETTIIVDNFEMGFSGADLKYLEWQKSRKNYL